MTDRTRTVTTPASIGTAVLLTISIGSSFVDPATILTTAETGDIALRMFPVNPTVNVNSNGEILAAAASGAYRGIIANVKAVPLPLSNTISAVRPTKMSGKTIPDAFAVVMAVCSEFISPIAFKPLTNVVAATNNATVPIALPMPLKNESVSSNTVLPFLRLNNSQTNAIINDITETTSTDNFKSAFVN